MNLAAEVGIVTAAAAVSACVTGLARGYAIKRAMLDLPNERSSHKQATPRGGGIGIVVTIMLAVGLLHWLAELDGQLALALVLGGGLIAAVGWMDDRRSLSVVTRAATHVLAASLAVFLLNNAGMAAAHSSTQAFALASLPGWLSVAIQVIGLVWFINLFNFLDGIDGYAGAQAVLASMAAAAVFAHAGAGSVVGLALAVSGACIGFLYWNWQPARIFMGDVGSCFLGFLFGVLALYGDRTGAAPAAIWTISCGIFFWDATLTLLRRVWAGERWYAAHRGHAYQRLYQLGWSHAKVTVAMMVVTVAWLWPLVWAAVVWDNFTPIALLAGGVVPGVLWLYINRCHARAHQGRVESLNSD